MQTYFWSSLPSTRKVTKIWRSWPGHCYRWAQVPVECTQNLKFPTQYFTVIQWLQVKVIHKSESRPPLLLDEGVWIDRNVEIGNLSAFKNTQRLVVSSHGTCTTCDYYFPLHLLSTCFVISDRKTCSRCFSQNRFSVASESHTPVWLFRRT